MIMNGEKIYNIPLRVCFYARVSTESDVQLNSLDNQLDYYKNYIKTKCNWTYVDGYVDEGISGIRVEKRLGFKRMIEDAKAGKFDLIITKEVSRFARDLEDSIHYIRLLKEANVGIFFENQNLNTFDYNSELILNIMFNLAQDESRKLSSRVKFGHREAIKKGHVLASSNIIGYKKDRCKLIIDEDEARIVRKIFELYSSGNYGFYKLSKKLGELGFYNKNGNFYYKDTLKRIIENPKYKGFYRGRWQDRYRAKGRKRKIFTQQFYTVIHRFMPANEPKIVVYVAINNPKGVTQYGGTVSAPVAKNVLKSAIEVLNIKPDIEGMKKTYRWYETEYIKLPDVEGTSLEDAKKTLKDFRLEYSGTGDTVLYMSPEPGYYIKKGGTVKIMLK